MAAITPAGEIIEAYNSKTPLHPLQKIIRKFGGFEEILAEALGMKIPSAGQNAAKALAYAPSAKQALIEDPIASMQEIMQQFRGCRAYNIKN